ncbi:trigger factor [Coxiella-like endosymbiont of Rhipicephalus sanguineus]|uniref:trigger factor n=1 Tax=Coxiella-like endosymbiont of Rhipicephalus sanguineus TaxID=1955402 RepID=UPI0027E1D4DE|nr:trigger factor [Coxiella-like endosymbiont of Rhipicephalus sanguineus]
MGKGFMSSIEKVGGLKQRLTVTVPAEDIEKAYQSRLKKVTQTAKLPKFRPGKAPLKNVEQRLGKSILQEVVGELVVDTLRRAVEENHLHIAGKPKVELGQVLRGQPLKYVVNYEIYPKIILNTLEGEKVERLNINVSEKDVANMLESLRTQSAEWKEADRAAKSGDRVIIDFEGTLDGKAFEGRSAKEFSLELGSHRMIPGFEEGIEGIKPGETKIIDVTFPTEYPSEDLAGKAATFMIKLHKVLEPELPTFDDKFVEKLGIKEGGVEALRAKVKENIEKEVHRYAENNLKMTVLDKLVERNPIEVPEVLVEAEIEHLQNMTRQQIASQIGKNDEAKKLELPREPYLERAKKRVVLGLLLGEVIKQHDIQADSAQIRSRIEEIAAAYPKPEEVVSWYYNKKRLAEVESVVLEDQAVAVLLNQLEVEERNVTYEEAVQQAQQGD